MEQTRRELENNMKSTKRAFEDLQSEFEGYKEVAEIKIIGLNAALVSVEDRLKRATLKYDLQLESKNRELQITRRLLRDVQTFLGQRWKEVASTTKAVEDADNSLQEIREMLNNARQRQAILEQPIMKPRKTCGAFITLNYHRHQANDSMADDAHPQNIGDDWILV